MITDVNINSALYAGLRGDVHTFVNTCLQPMPVMARVCSRFVTAFGVVGFWRVKDEPKGVFIAEASASACNAAQIQKKRTQREQPENNPNTKREHLGDGRKTT